MRGSRWRALVVAPLVGLLFGCAKPANVVAVAPEPAKSIEYGAPSAAIALQKIVIRLPIGYKIGARELGVLCLPRGDLIWENTGTDTRVTRLATAFAVELNKANYHLVSVPVSAVSPAKTDSAEIVIAAEITSFQENVCWPYNGYGNFTAASAEANETVDWKIWRQSDPTAVISVTTNGYAKVDTQANGGIVAATSAFSMATQNLLAENQFYQIASNQSSPVTSAASASAPANSSLSAAMIPMHQQGGTYVVPVLINGAITLDFTVDSGAADVTVPADVVLTLMRTGTIQPSDFLGKKTFVLADGRTMPSSTFRIKSLKVGNKVVENVTGTIAPVQGTPLLGQSFLSRLKGWSVDNSRHSLILQ